MRVALARSGLLVPALVAELLAAGLTLLPGLWVPVTLGSAVIAVVAGALLSRRTFSRTRFGGRFLIATAVCTGAVALAVGLQQPARDPDWLPTGEPVRAVLRVESVTPIASNDHAGALTRRLLVRAVLLSATVGRVPHPASAPLVVFADRLSTAAQAPGTTVAAVLVLRRAQPGDDVDFTAGTRGAVRIVARADPVQRAAQALRAGLVRRAATLAGDGGALLPGLAIGDTSRVSETLDQAMKDASLSHLTAVSGANCAVVIVAVLGLATLARLPRWARGLTAGAALAGFVVLVTGQPSVLRAAVMAAVALACLVTGRRAMGAPVLAVAVLVLLLGDPWLARNPGFLLSALATGGLLLLTRPIADRLARVLPRRLALALAVPIAAQLACEPVLVLLQPTVPLAGVLANLAAEPAAPVVTVLGLLSCLLLPVAPALGSGLALLAWVPAAWIAAVARAAASMPAVPWPVGAAGGLLAVVLLGLGLLAAGRGVRRPVRVTAAVLGLAALVVGFGVLVGTAVARSAGPPADWEIAGCDVGQGDAFVLNGGAGRFALVDTGRQPAPIRACLDRLGVRRIDLLVLTHWDADHVGASRSIADRVTTAFVGPTDGAAADGLEASIAAAGARVLHVHRGEHTQVGRLRLDVLWPTDPLGDIQPGNPASITLLVTGRIRSLFTGDLGEDAQTALLALGPLPHVDVVKVAHHGSADQSPAFYEATGAAAGLMGVGAGNDYHHPTARLLRILRADGIAPFRTDQDGLLLVAPGVDGGLRVWTEHPVTAAVWSPAP
ncbi:MAG TPA: ComEC/Rec2 family competence protein [Amnibacterium sp.]|nr:ComEC/Rec2 family competence protein [Amnibacterium sp.]